MSGQFPKISDETIAEVKELAEEMARREQAQADARSNTYRQLEPLKAWAFTATQHLQRHPVRVSWVMSTRSVVELCEQFGMPVPADPDIAELMGVPVRIDDDITGVELEIRVRTTVLEDL